MTDRKDRIRVHISGREFSIVGGSFQEMLAAVKQINGRRFVSELKVWELPGSPDDVQHQLDISGLRLEGGKPIATRSAPERTAPSQAGGDRVRLLVAGRRMAVTGGGFQDMLSMVKGLPGRRFNNESKTWEIPGEADIIKALIETAGYQLEGAENIQFEGIPPMESLDFLGQAAPPPPFEEPDFFEEDDLAPPEPPDWWDDDLAPPPDVPPEGWDDEAPPLDEEATFTYPESPPDSSEPAQPRPRSSAGQAGKDQIRLRWGNMPLVVSGGTFQDMLAVIKNIPDRRFNGQEKIWEIPERIPLETIQQKIKAAGFVLKGGE